MLIFLYKEGIEMSNSIYKVNGIDKEFNEEELKEFIDKILKYLKENNDYETYQKYKRNFLGKMIKEVDKKNRIQ